MFKSFIGIGTCLLCLYPNIAVLASPQDSLESEIGLRPIDFNRPNPGLSHSPPSLSLSQPQENQESSSINSSEPSKVSLEAEDLLPLSNQADQEGEETPKSVDTSQQDLAQSSPAFDKSIIPSRTENPLQPNSTEENLNIADPSHQEQDEDYILAPRIADKNRILPLTTTIPLNGIPVSHLTDWQVGTGYEFGPEQTEQFLIDGVYQLSGKVVHSITKDNVFVSEQTGTFLQLQTVRDENTITVTRKDPVTSLGFQEQLSFVGSCDALETPETLDPDSLCSFLPAVVTDLDSIDPDTLQPTRFNQPGNFGDVLSPETVSALREPGFLGVAPNGQTLGIDLFFPRISDSVGNSFGNATSIDRSRDSDRTLAGGIYRVSQIFKSNYEKAVIGRTIRGFTGIGSERNLGINLATQVLPQLFPTVNPTLKGSDQPPNSSININLFTSANHTRIPRDSFVIYQAGLGHARHKEKEKKKPKAYFNSVWLGLSPVAERSLFRSSRVNALGPTNLTETQGIEGDVGSGTSFISLIDDGILQRKFSSQDLSLFYNEIYLSFFETDAEIITTNTIQEKFTFFPHISISGNITGEDEVFRYYGGLITSDKKKFYAGLDYTRRFGQSWELSASAIGYTNPDPDYFSRIEGRLSKSIFSNPRSALRVSSNFRYVLDRPSGTLVDFTDALLNDPVDDSLSLEILGRLGPVTAAVTQFFEIGSNSTPTSTGGRISFDVSENLSLSGYITPNKNLLSYGALMRLRLNRSLNAPTLSFGWDRTDINFDRDAAGNDLNTSENRFLILFRTGSPSAPFQLPRSQAS